MDIVAPPCDKVNGDKAVRAMVARIPDSDDPSGQWYETHPERGLTVTKVSDHGPDNSHTLAWMCHLHTLDFLDRLEVVTVVQDDEVDKGVSVILHAASNKNVDSSRLPYELVGPGAIAPGIQNLEFC